VKVLFINPIAQLGGAERSLLDLLWAFRELDADVNSEVLAFEDGPLLGAARELGVVASVVESPSELNRLGDSNLGLGSFATVAKSVLATGRVTAFLARARRRILESHPDLIHTNGLKAHAVGAMIRPRGTHLLWHLRDFMTPRPVVRRLLPKLKSRASAAIAISEAVGMDVRLYLKEFPIHVVLNGVRTGRFDTGGRKAADLDALAGFASSPPGTVRVGMLGTLATWKGHRLFLDSIARLKDLPARFYLVTGALYSTSRSQYSLEDLRQEIGALGLAHRVGVIPFQHDPLPIYTALDIVVHASTRPEPFGRVVAEAMSAGKLVVASESGGILEQVTPDETALTFPIGDSSALAGALKRGIADEHLRRSMGRRAQAHAVKHLDVLRVGREVRAIYLDVTVGRVRGVE
jgi:glycosyltransferase involved in cell wall biosynthesis